MWLVSLVFQWQSASRPDPGNFSLNASQSRSERIIRGLWGLTGTGLTQINELTPTKNLWYYHPRWYSIGFSLLVQSSLRFWPILALHWPRRRKNFSRPLRIAYALGQYVWYAVGDALICHLALGVAKAKIQRRWNPRTNRQSTLVYWTMLPFYPWRETAVLGPLIIMLSIGRKQIRPQVANLVSCHCRPQQ